MSSEPKNAAGEPSARKASKKSSKRPSDAAVNPSAAPPSVATAGAMDGPSQLSMAPAAASPVPRLHDVPRIPIAEPKAAATGDSAPGGGGEPKPRASKKRTASPPDAAIPASAGGPSMPSTSSIGASSSAPAADAAAVAAAAKDAADGEREKQAAAARREAKRQRAKELEEAKHREELAKQAVEEAKRAEEARVREQRRKQELAALNANAEECQEEEEGQGDYEEDGFENYDDDFEDDATTQPAKARGNNDSSSSRTDALSPAELKKIQQALQAESKELSTSRSSSASSKAGDNNSSSSSQSLQATGSEKKKKSSATSTSISSSIAGLKQSLDPRAKRAKEVLDARRFEVEKFNLFHQAPLSEQETYLSSLRRGQVRQVAVYTNDGAKAAAVQTKYPAGVDKSMHFPDDIGLDSEASTSGTGGGGDDDGVGAHSTVRFFKFLEHAAYACELLAEGNAAAAAELELESTTSSARKRLSVSQSTPLSSHQVLPSKQFDDPAVEALLHGRDLVALRFSPCVSNILVACYGPLEACAASREHPPELAEVAALLKDKGVSCVWDVNQPHQALHVLKNEGQLSAVCLSPNRELIALAGTDDGSIHVWDLRRQPFRSASSKSARLVLCSPTYSTSGVDYKSPSQHASTIVGLEVVVRTSETYGSSAGGTFQFGSMDDRGIVIIWSLIEFEAGEDALIADKCVEIGGRVKMVMNTLIDTQQQYMVARPPPPRRLERTGIGNASLSTSRSATASLGDPVCSVGPIATVLKFFPSDPNQFVVGTRTGLVYRGHRFEKTQNAASRRVYRRGGGRASPRAMAAAAVVCVDFHPFSPEYFLVGYEDGGVCLFQCSAGTCLSSWDEMAFGVSVSSVRWSTSRPGVFYASFSNAQVLVWDLTEQTHAPVLSHSVPALETSSPVELASSLYPLALSSEKIRVSRPTIALRSGDSLSFQFALHELSQELATRSRDEALETATLLSHIL